MKFSPSTDWLTLCNGSNKIRQWRIFARMTDDMSESIDPEVVDATAWTEVTGYISDFSDPGSKIEYEVGQSTTDSVSFTGQDIAWWKANIFTAYFVKPQYIEIKIEFRLGYSPAALASDVCYVFNGFVKDRPTYNELKDSVEFTAYTAEDIASGISAMTVNTQYIDARTGYLVLPQLRGFFVVNAAIAGKVLRTGVHSVTYDYNAGERRAKLDDGEWVTLPTISSTFTLTTKDLAQQLGMYMFIDSLAESSSELSDIVIVQTEGNTLPRQPVSGTPSSRLIKLLYSKIGIIDVRQDSLTLTTHDGRSALSYIDYPPGSFSVPGDLTSITNDGTKLFIALGYRVYSRNMTSETYSNIIELGDTTSVIKKMVYTSRTNDLWIMYSCASGDCIRKFNLTTSTLSIQVLLTSTRETVSAHSLELVDKNYTGTSYKYGMMWMKQESPAVLRFIDATTMASAAAYTFASGIDYIGDAAAFMFAMAANSICAILRHVGYSTNMLYKFTITSSGNVTCAEVFDGFPDFGAAAYSQSEDRIYYIEPVEAMRTTLKSVNGGAAGDHVTTPVVVLPDITYYAGWQMLSSAGGSIYTSDPLVPPLGGRSCAGTLYKIDANVAVEVDSETLVLFSGMTQMGSTTYGVDWFGRLFQISPTIKMFHTYSDYTKLTIRDFLKKILSTYMLIGYISGEKVAYVYRRGNGDGVPQTTGNTLPISVANASDITENTSTYRAFDTIELSNGVDSTSYNGTAFDAAPLIDARILSITNEMIPSNILKDVCKYLYQFFKTDRVVYSIPLAIPAFQFEPFDAGELSFTTTKVQKTATGPIYSCKYNKQGTMDVEVLI